MRLANLAKTTKLHLTILPTVKCYSSSYFKTRDSMFLSQLSPAMALLNCNKNDLPLQEGITLSFNSLRKKFILLEKMTSVQSYM